jgi:hypothetical protein
MLTSIGNAIAGLHERRSVRELRVLAWVFVMPAMVLATVGGLMSLNAGALPVFIAFVAWFLIDLAWMYYIGRTIDKKQAQAGQRSVW